MHNVGKEKRRIDFISSASSPPDRKRHTARGVSSLAFLFGRGYPCSAKGVGLGIPLYCLVERDTAVLTRDGGAPCPVKWGAVPCHVRAEYPNPILAGFPLGETWDRTLDRTSVRTRGYPSGKDLGPEAEKGPGNRGWDTPPVDRQTPVKILPSRGPTYTGSKKCDDIEKILLNVPNCVKFYE